METSGGLRLPRGDDKLTSETLILRLMNINDLTDLGLVDLFPINGLFYGP